MSPNSSAAAAVRDVAVAGAPAVGRIMVGFVGRQLPDHFHGVGGVAERLERTAKGSCLAAAVADDGRLRVLVQQRVNGPRHEHARVLHAVHSALPPGARSTTQNLCNASDMKKKDSIYSPFWGEFPFPFYT